MEPIHRRRRDHRARAPKRLRRRNLAKFVPEADRDFAFTAHRFVTALQADPAAFGVSAANAAQLAAAVSAYRAALSVAVRRRSRTMDTILAKDEARGAAERAVRTIANVIRANPDVSAAHRRLLRIKDRPTKLNPRKCPQRPPVLQFVGSAPGVAGDAAIGGGRGVHVLAFFDLDGQGVVQRAKPRGAARLELFFDLVPPHEPVPAHPAERSGWPRYLRSFTRSPMEVAYPVPAQPMLVVYWARWADATGAVGRWSKTCVGRVEGWTARPAVEVQHGARALPGSEGATGQIETRYMFVHPPLDLPDPAERGEVIDTLSSRLLTVSPKTADGRAA